jgi:hypothetical protein
MVETKLSLLYRKGSRPSRLCAFGCNRRRPDVTPRSRQLSRGVRGKVHVSRASHMEHVPHYNKTYITCFLFSLTLKRLVVDAKLASL